MTEEQQSKVDEFLRNRKPFYIDSSTLGIKVVNGNDANMDFAHIFYKYGYPWLTTIRGYVMENEFIMIYTDDYEIPNCTVALLQHLFIFFPNTIWIGLGCIKGEPGEIWKPRFIVERDSKYLPYIKEHEGIERNKHF